MVQTRRVLEKDAKEVAELSAQLGYKTTSIEMLERIKRLAKTSENCAFIAIVDNKVIGCIHGFYTIRLESSAFVEIAGLVVDLNYRKINIGKKLINEVLDWAKAHDVEKVKVRCNVIRADTHNFYKKIGFKLVKQQKIFFN